MKGNGAVTDSVCTEERYQASKPGKIDLMPVTMNSIPKAINSSPIIRVITLIPVWPNRRTNHGAMRNSPQQHRANSAIATKSQTG